MQLSDACQMPQQTSDRHLTIVWRLSDRKHQTNSNCLAETVTVNQLNFACDLISRISRFWQIREIKMRKQYCRACSLVSTAEREIN